jgi:iron(III) transport system ATP-binding protein
MPEADMPEALTVGEAVEIAIRPENIRLSPQGVGAPVQLAAKIRDGTFLGSIMEYHVALEDGTMLRVQTHPLDQFAIGDAVAVHIDAGQCTVFRAQDRPTASSHEGLGVST